MINATYLYTQITWLMACKEWFKCQKYVMCYHGKLYNMYITFVTSKFIFYKDEKKELVWCSKMVMEYLCKCIVLIKLLSNQDELQFLLNLRQMIKYQNILQLCNYFHLEEPYLKGWYEVVEGFGTGFFKVNTSHISVENYVAFQTSIIIWNNEKNCKTMLVC